MHQPLKRFTLISAAILALGSLSAPGWSAPKPIVGHAVASKKISDVKRLVIEREVQNLMGYYEEYQQGGDFKKVAELFALDLPDVSWAPGPGTWTGPEAVKSVLLAQHARPDDPEWMAIHKGELHVHTLATPIIVVADDGKTAKGSWDSPGMESLTGKGRKPEARWAWCKYGVDFIKTPKGWKIWHLVVTGITFNPYDKSWVDSPGFPAKPGPTDVGGEWPEPTSPQSANWIYTGEGIQPLLPPPPLPYRTFSETFRY